MITKNKYNLGERTEKFAESIIKLAEKITKTVITAPIISQLVRSGTSIGVNYCEADEAQSKKDSIHKISLCKKETRETRYWLKMITISVQDFLKEVELLQNEAKELNLIFASIVRRSTDNK